MGKLMMAWIYLSSFFNVVVLNCIQPVNWENCGAPQEWLFPEIHRGIKFMFEPNIYEEEREKLEGGDGSLHNGQKGTGTP